MWFILSAVVSAACAIPLSRLVTLIADTFVGLLKAPGQAPGADSSSDSAPESGLQMATISLFVTGLYFYSFAQSGWLLLSFAAGLIGAVSLLAFICLLGIAVRGAQWLEYGASKFYREKICIIDRVYEAALHRHNH